MSDNTETLCKLYLELANVVPKDCVSSREIALSAKSHGCICPPGSEKTCQGPLCPRRAVTFP